MKIIRYAGLVAAGIAVSASSLASDVWNDTGATYIDAMAQYSLLDDKRISKDDFGFQGGLGYNFAPNFALEIDYSTGSFKLKDFGSAGPREQLRATSLDALYKFLPNSIVRPFILVGTGQLEDRIGASFDSNNSWMAEAGVGALTGIGSQSGSTRLQLRTEAKYRREFIQNNLYIPNNPSDVVFGVGLQLSFGNPTPPAPVAAAAPPPPPPEPAPAPVVAPPPPEPCHAPAGFKVDANCHIIEQNVVVRAVDFEFNSTQLTAPAQQTLDEVAAALLTQPELNVEVQGHTDSIGTDAYNLGLSQRRADAVRAYLISKGLSSSVLTAKGYGKSKPIASNATAEGRAQNRRVAFEVTNGFAHVHVIKEDASDASTEAAKQGEPPNAKKKSQE